MPNNRAPLARTPLHDWHVAHGARLSDRHGWQVVADYGDARGEAAAARAGLALVDVSAFAKLSLRGPGLPGMAPGSVSSLPSGQALACRLTANHLLLLATALGQALADFYPAPALWRTDVTSALAGFRLLGRQAEELLGRLTNLDVRSTALPVDACAETALAGVEALLVRTAAAWQIHVAWDVGEYVWTRLLESGRDLAVRAVGLDALA
jgi:heterotetrameric sarcosine oxidase gamma subunit